VPQADLSRQRQAKALAIIPLTNLHNTRYFMHVCEDNATNLHLSASEGGTDFSLWSSGGGVAKVQINHRLEVWAILC